MTIERFRRVESLFNAAVVQPPGRHAEFLRASEADPEIRAEVLRLLEHAHASGPHPFEAGLREVEMARAPMPERIGPYRLLRQIGEGGMGGVFLAERDIEGVVQRVALKLLHGIATEGGKRRMARERELLAGLNHPHIAGLIDGGLTADGQPYLVMDYVEGTTLAEHLAAHAPTLADRIRLHLQCCDAVQHAHQRLILHRDIKPANIIVGFDGTPVLLDFGVGKLLEAGVSDVHTATLAFTPGYAAPEQLHGETATTATDVFGLGALLFDVLTDLRLPTLRRGDARVPLPSDHVADPARRRELRGDLDRIVTKATATAPELRYLTVAALGDDLRRFLRGEPVLAAPDAFAYRMRKFVGRHRWAVAAGALVVVVLAGFVWRLDAERARALRAEAAAERAAEDAKREASNAGAARDFLTSVLIAARPADATEIKPITVDSLVATAIRTLNRDADPDPHTRATAWATIARIYSGINNPRLSLAATEAADAYLKLARTPDPELSASILIVRSGSLAALSRFAEAKALDRQLIALRERQKAAPDRMANAYYASGVTLGLAGESDAAIKQLERALSLVDADGTPDGLRMQQSILMPLIEINWQEDRLEAADRHLSRMQAVLRRLPDLRISERQQSHQTIAMVRVDQGRFAEAIRHAETALTLSRKLYGDRSGTTAGMHSLLGYVLKEGGRSREALVHLRRWDATLRSMDLQTPLGSREMDIAVAHAQVGDYAGTIREATRALRAIPARGEAEARARSEALVWRGYAYAKSGQFARAWGDLDAGLALVDKESRAHTVALMRYADALREAGRVTEARAVLDRIAAPLAKAKAKFVVGGTSWMALSELEARMALDEGELPQARERIRQMQAALRERQDANPVKLARLQMLQAALARKTKDTERARTLARGALPVLEREMVPEAPLLREARLIAAMSSDRD